MSDEHGIANALKAFLQVLTVSSRGMGRSQRMLNKVERGDIVIVSNENQRNMFERKLADRFREHPKKLNIHVIAANPKDPIGSVFARRDIKKRPTNVHIDHTFAEAYYQYTLLRAQEDYNYMIRELEGDQSGNSMYRSQDHSDAQVPLSRFPPQNFQF